MKRVQESLGAVGSRGRCVEVQVERHLPGALLDAVEAAVEERAHEIAFGVSDAWALDEDGLEDVLHEVFGLLGSTAEAPDSDRDEPGAEVAIEPVPVPGVGKRAIGGVRKGCLRTPKNFVLALQ